jgi:HlyD family secretion protein
MKRRTLLAILIPGVVLAALILYSVLSGKEKDIVLEAEVEQGQFEISVKVTGELQASRETAITAPSQLRSRNLRIRGVTIQDLIEEGTVVDSGDWVATLDRSEADNSLKDISDNLEQEESEYMRTILDTTMTLRQLRDELINLNFSMEEAKITLEQSQYEPPATIRQAEIELEKATRAYEQAQKNYGLKVQQARAQMREAEISLARDRRSKEEMESILNQFDIHAPGSGMVIYYKDWDGTKRTVGAEISPWDLTVATLPDLSNMISVTYVNEIDISKIKTNQRVRIGVDAFPEKKFTGIVSSVANIGQQLPNTDAKVFEVKINMQQQDSILRPSMTTSNEIITHVMDDVLFVPLEAVHADDSITYVYTRSGKRQIVLLGESNENHIIVEKGLTRGEKIYLSLPEEPENFAFAGTELIPEIKQKKAEEQKKLEEKNRPGQMRPGERGQWPEGASDRAARWRSQGVQGERPQGVQGERPQGMTPAGQEGTSGDTARVMPQGSGRERNRNQKQ